MDHRNLRGARRGVAKELYRADGKSQSFPDFWRALNDALAERRFAADTQRRLRHAQAATA